MTHLRILAFFLVLCCPITVYADPLIDAIQKGDSGQVKALLAGGANAKAQDKGGTPAIILAVKARDLATVEALISYGAEVDAKDQYERTALIHAAVYGDLDILNKLLEHNANVNGGAKLGSALIQAAIGCHVEVVEALLARRADVNLKYNGYTASEIAVRKQCPEIARRIDPSAGGGTTHKPRLTVQADPPQSEVRVATAAGKSIAYSAGMELEPGEYQIQVTHQGYRPEQRQVTLKENLQLAIGLSHSVGTTLAKSQLPQALAPTITIQRYCTLEAPDEVIADQEFAIQVALTVEQITPEVKIVSGSTTAEGQLALSLPAQDAWQIDVVMSASRFTFRDGTNIAALVLPLQGDSTPAVFYLRAKPIQGVRQTGNVYMTLWYRGAFLGKVVRQITMVAPAHVSPSAVSAPARAVSGVALPSMRAPLQSIALHLGGTPPDLTVFLLDEEGIMLLLSPHLQPTQHTFSAPKDLSAWLNVQYARFAQEVPRGLVNLDTDPVQSLPERARRQALLRGVGRELYQKFAPPAFQDAFWHLRDKMGTQFQSIQIYSSNPLLPWELMRPSRANGTEELDFLALEFRIARWHISQRSTQLDRPPPTMPLHELAVIAPQYTGALFLPNQASEIQALQLVAGYRRVPGQLTSVQDLFAHVPTGIVHFSGHGVVQEKSQGIFEYAIRLEDIELDLLTWRGFASQHPHEHPFIFFNACDIGQAHRVANFVSGWAPAMLEAGASGYIGSLWPLGDKGAALFATAFYQRLQQGLNQGPVTVAEVIREARRLFYTDFDPTFLAYVYYGDPNFQFIRRL